MMTRISSLFALCLLPVLSACTSAPNQPLKTVDDVDLTRYAGTWYEIALLPNKFQAQCVSDTQAQYRIDGEVVRVRNRCRNAEDKIEEANGVAKVVAGSGNAKLRVSFFRPFYGDYWILALDKDYRTVLIGEPSRKYSWILSRDPHMSTDQREQLLEQAQSLGFDRSAYKISKQLQPLE